MAVVNDIMQTYGQSTANDYEIAMGVHMITPVDTPMQLLLPKIQVGAKKAEWIEDALQAQKSALTATVSDTTGVSITVSTADGTNLFPADVATYNVIVRIDEEFMLVTAESAGVLTVTRGYGGSTAATHASAAVVDIVSELQNKEGGDAKQARAQTRTRPSNYLQTFARTVEVSGVQEAVRKLGGITSEIDYQIMQSIRQLALELEKTIIMGPQAAAGSASAPSRMAGLLGMISTNVTSDSGAIDTTAIEADIETIWNAGGIPRLILTTGALAQNIGNLYTDRIRTQVETQIGGERVVAIDNPLARGGPLVIVPHRNVAYGEYYMLDTSRMALGYLRPFFMKDLADAGDADKRWIGGDYTLELMNETAHVRRYGFTE